MITRRAFYRYFIVLLLLFLVWIFIFPPSHFNQNQSEKPCVDRFNGTLSYPIYSLRDHKIDVDPKPKSKYPSRVHYKPRYLCPEDKETMYFIIHSENTMFANRDYIRREVFSNSLLRQLKAKRIFVVGRGNRRVEETVEKEGIKHQDILVVDIEEHYHNITYKVQSWVKTLARCKLAPEFIVKMDDDVMVDNVGLHHLINRFRTHKSSVACKVFGNGQISRNPQSKWYLSMSEYSRNSLGIYCQGMAIMFSGNLLKPMRRNIRRVQHLWMDDWYLTHALLNNTDAVFVDIGRHIISTTTEGDAKNLLSIKRKSPVVFSHFRPPKLFPLSRRISFWEEIKRQQNCL